jgi:hypothetical protein
VRPDGVLVTVYYYCQRRLKIAHIWRVKIAHSATRIEAAGAEDRSA